MSKNDTNSERLDAAARAGWLYYVAGNKQDEIAKKLNVSRQSAQRLVSLAVEEKLVKIQIDHPIARCMEYADAITERFGLKVCDVTPTDQEAPNSLNGIAIAGAASIRRYLEQSKPQVIALGTGRSMRACIEQIPRMECPQHHMVSMAGNMKPDGSATSYNTIVRLAARVSARHNPYPVAVFVRTPEEREIWYSLEPIEMTLRLCSNATVSYVGIGNIADSAPVMLDGMLAQDEVWALQRVGAVGEIIGWAFDKEGNLIEGLSNSRNTSAPLKPNNPQPVIGIAIGAPKVAAILAALKGRLINGLITDEATAAALLETP